MSLHLNCFLFCPQFLSQVPLQTNLAYFRHLPKCVQPCTRFVVYGSLFFIFVCVCLCVWRQQELSNLLQEKKYLKALGLAISLDQPHTVLTVIKGTLCSPLRFELWTMILGYLRPVISPVVTFIRYHLPVCQHSLCMVAQFTRQVICTLMHTYVNSSLLCQRMHQWIWKQQRFCWLMLFCLVQWHGDKSGTQIQNMWSDSSLNKFTS